VKVRQVNELLFSYERYTFLEQNENRFVDHAKRSYSPFQNFPKCPAPRPPSVMVSVNLYWHIKYLQDWINSKINLFRVQIWKHATFQPVYSGS